MDVQRLLKFQNPAGFQPEWGYEDVQLTFFKCTKWQVEQTLDPFSCPYHYFCDTNYPGSYPAYVDALFLLVVAAAYLVTFVVMVMELAASTSRTANNNNEICRSKRIACRVQGKSAKSRSVAVKRLVERLSWVMIVKDCVYLAVRSPPEISNLPSLGMGAVILLVCLHVVKKVA
ncbi:hypothetical protein LINGRAHAP2_LOCUS16040, partial [Linum grandiflorum]